MNGKDLLDTTRVILIEFSDIPWDSNFEIVFRIIVVTRMMFLYFPLFDVRAFSQNIQNFQN